MPHRPTQPPPPPARSRPPSGSRPSRSLWAPLLLACAVAAVAFTAAVSGGTLPGLSDAASSADAAPSTAQPPAATSSTPAPAALTAPVSTAPVSTAPVSTAAVPSATPSPTPTPTPTPETSSVAAPPTTPEPAADPPAETTAAAEAPGPPPAAATAATVAAPGPEEQMLTLVNAERAAAGCGAVSADESLAAVARAHSADMRDRDFFSHVNPEGLDPFARARAAGIDSARAENIAYGQPDAAAVMAAWMDSAGHRQNILDCSLQTLGVGVATGPGGPWWTQLFGA